MAVSDRSPPDSRDSRLTFLPGGLASMSMPVVSMSSGSVSTSLPSPPGNSLAMITLELALDVGIGGREHLLHALVDLPDHGQQVATGLLQVFELGDEERVPLLQRRELLQRQRVDLAELVKLALRVLRPPLLRFPVIGDGELALVRPGHRGRPGRTR